MKETPNAAFLKQYIPLAQGLQRYLGDLYEIILHDTSAPDCSVQYVAGNLTGRSPGGPLTNVVIAEMRHHGNDVKDMIGYMSQMQDGRIFKSATIFIRDDAGMVRGCFCINMNTSAIQPAVDFLNGVLSMQHSASKEVFAQNINELMDNIVTSELESSGISLDSMKRVERLNFIHALDKKGVFDVKGSVEHVAQLLGISVFTVYSDLKEISQKEND